MSPRSPAAALVAAAPLFAALGDTTRLGLVARLSAEGPQSITALTAGAGVTRQAVTKHLKALSGAGLVRSRRRGRETHWRLEPAPLAKARLALESISAQWDDALGRLQQFVEEER
jgi:DNA-binding transcriptional ArsR family regulator